MRGKINFSPFLRFIKSLYSFIHSLLFNDLVKYNVDESVRVKTSCLKLSYGAMIIMAISVTGGFYCRTQILSCDASLCAIQASVNPSFSSDPNETKLVYIILQRSSAKPVYTHCTCTVGLRIDCSHVGAVLFVLCDVIAEGCEELPADPTCTDMKCKWTDPKVAN